MPDLTTSATTSELGRRSVMMMSAAPLREFREVYHRDAVNREAHAEPPQSRGTGPDAFYATARWLRAAFSDLSFTVEHVVHQSRSARGLRHDERTANRHVRDLDP